MSVYVCRPEFEVECLLSHPNIFLRLLLQVLQLQVHVDVHMSIECLGRDRRGCWVSLIWSYKWLYTVPYGFWDPNSGPLSL